MICPPTGFPVPLSAPQKMMHSIAWAPSMSQKMIRPNVPIPLPGAAKKDAAASTHSTPSAILACRICDMDIAFASRGSPSTPSVALTRINRHIVFPGAERPQARRAVDPDATGSSSRGETWTFSPMRAGRARHTCHPRGHNGPSVSVSVFHHWIQAIPLTSAAERYARGR